jgi:hypothetical protein
MPLQKLQFRPGINREGTNYSNEGGWYDCDKVRFRSGFPQKLGGWVQATGDRNYDGLCRMMINWVDLAGNNLIGIGTHVKYYINNGLTTYRNITPIRLERSPTTTPPSALSNPFTTVNGSFIVTVSDTNNSAQPGDYVTFSGATGFAGIDASELNTEHKIINIVNANSYQIQLLTAATSSTTGGGATVSAYYQLNIGLPAYTIGNGFGAGVWNGANSNNITADLTYTSGSGNVLLDALSTTINVDDTTGFTASGTIQIDSEIITYSGKTATSFTGCTRGVQNNITFASTTLNGGINASVTTITLTSVTGFTAPVIGAAIVRVDNELISYTGVNTLTNELTGCVRGTNGTTAASHLTGATIAEYGGLEHALDPTTGSATPPPIIVYQITSFLPATGATGWGLASNVTFGTIGQQMRLWSNDNYGQDLLINPRGGDIYYWVDNTSTYPAAVTLQSKAESLGYTALAPYIPNATNQIVVSDVSRFVIAMGANPYELGNPGSTFDPLLVRWSDQENPYDWVPETTNQAGDTRLTNGSYIMTSRKTRQEILIWTDAALYSMQYLGPPYTFGFTLLMDNLSIMSPGAATVINNVAYWMGTDKFYSYTGRVETLPCSVRQYIFNDLNFDQRFQVISGSSEGYNEIWWYYVSNAENDAAVEESRTPIVDKYVVYNHLERIWYYGTLSRTFWLDTPLQQYPMSANPITANSTLPLAINDSATSIQLVSVTNFAPYGTVQIGTEHISYVGVDEDTFTLLNCTRGIDNTVATSHAANDTVVQLNNLIGSMLFQENGVDDASTATPVPFTSYIQSSDFDIGDGHNFGFVWRIIPDITFAGSGTGNQANTYPSVTMEVRPRTFSGTPYGPTDIDTVTSAQPYGVVKQYTIEEYTPQVYTRIRGRQIAFKISSQDQLGVTWQLGSPRIDIRPDGRR